MAKNGGRMAGALGLLRNDVLNAYPYRCAVIRNRNASCRRCAEACTGGAIRVDGDEVRIDAARCTGCGTCATVCPTCAIEVASPNDAALALQARAALAAAGGTAVIACDRAFEAAGGAIDPARAARVRCLGRADESLLVRLAAQGAREVVLVHGDCEGCPRSAGCATWQRVAGTANTLFEAWGLALRVEACGSAPACVLREDGAGSACAEAAAPGGLLDLEEFYAGVGGADAVLSGAADRGASGAEGAGLLGHAACELPERLHAMADGTLPHFVPDRRERLLDALAELGEPRAGGVLQTHLFARVEIDASACRTCWMCATFCPTGALSKPATEVGAARLEHAPAECVQCGTCADVCPKGCLVLLTDVPAEVVARGEAALLELPEPPAGRNTPGSMFHAVKGLLGIENVYQY